MTKIIRHISILAFLFFFTPLASAEEISNFEQEIRVGADSVLEVSEIISYDFGVAQKHGIFRDIPYKYKARGGNYELRFEDIRVTDRNGETYPFSVSNYGDMKRIKIGDPDRTVSGQMYYRIDYKLKRALNYFVEHDEIYWNVTGDAWPVPIRQSKSTVILPTALPESELQSECFSGELGSDQLCVSKRHVYEGAGMVKEIVFIDDVLQPGLGFTIVVGLPKGVVTEPGLFSKTWEIVKDNWIVLLPFLLFWFLFKVWQNYGRDKGGRGVIVAQFDAPNQLSPMGVGTLIDEKADNKDFSANLISLATKGYLRIVKMKTGLIFKSDDYALVRLPGKEALRNSEQMIFDAIFKVKNIEKKRSRIDEIAKIAGEEVTEAVMMSDLRNVFYKDLKKIKDAIYEELYREGYFVSNPYKTRSLYLGIGFTSIIPGILIGGILFGPIGLFSLLLCSLLIIGFAYFIPKKTVKGVEAYEHILGLKKYLEVAEKDRLDFHNAPEKNPRTFEKLLPYAMVLGVEKKWAKQFEGIYNQEPDWYRGGTVHAFSAGALASDLGSFRSYSATTASTSPSSTASSGRSGFSGGGSGGGFGGGGGGSW